MLHHAYQTYTSVTAMIMRVFLVLTLYWWIIENKVDLGLVISDKTGGSHSQRFKICFNHVIAHVQLINSYRVFASDFRCFLTFPCRLLGWLS